MNRPIKFMAWVKDEKRLLKVEEISWHNEEEHGEYLTFLLEDGGGREGDDNIDLYQFTGLLDKDGKEIYEGHKIRWNKREWVIEWNTLNAQWFMATHPDSKKGGWGFFKERMAKCGEIIGHIAATL
ncbi:MAG: hypothetical protein KAJ07_00325 [Planctomycetes bacterium]|nr:hypothetical protein [Planctomycetota bacterium]